MQTLTLAEAWRIFKNKAGCRRDSSQAAAGNASKVIWPYLTDETKKKLAIAWNHALQQEGRAEFDEACMDIEQRMQDLIEVVDG